jgi:hypothetical protein
LNACAKKRLGRISRSLFDYSLIADWWFEQLNPLDIIPIVWCLLSSGDWQEIIPGMKKDIIDIFLSIMSFFN